MAPTGGDPDAGGLGATTRASARALAKAGTAETVVLVEGITDQQSLETAAALRGRDLDAERVVVVPIGGAHAIRRFVARFAPTGVRLAGLCDRAEADLFRRAFADIPSGSPHAHADPAALGFHVCVDDLEDELIRAVGAAGVRALFDAQGDLRSFRSFQTQPAWRDRDPAAQTYRFLRSSSQRNLRYVRLLTEAAARRDALPRPLEALLTAVAG